MNRRNFLAGCAFGAPLIAIATGVQAHATVARATGMKYTSKEWPLDIVELEVFKPGAVLFKETHMIPSWGVKK
jgi:hypothetical protein